MPIFDMSTSLMKADERLSPKKPKQNRKEPVDSMNAQIDVTLTTEQSAGITAAVTGLTTAMPFLLGYSPEERRRLQRLGPRRESFARLAVETAAQNPDLIPASVGLPELERDLVLHETMTSVRTQLQQILQQVEDTQQAAGWDLYNGSLEIYRALKSHGRNRALGDTLLQLKTRLRKVTAKPVEEEETPTSGMSNP